MANKHLWSTKLTANDSTAQEEVGIERTEWSSADSCFKTYKYVQAASDTTVANGTALAYVDTKGKKVTSDISDADVNQPAGVGIGAITANYYGWILIRGYHSAIKTNGDDDISDGDSLVLCSTDGTVDSVASGTAPTSKIIGVAVAADNDDDDTVAGMVSVY